MKIFRDYKRPDEDALVKLVEFYKLEARETLKQKYSNSMSIS